jgi:hypothetical protein
MWAFCMLLSCVISCSVSAQVIEWPAGHGQRGRLVLSMSGDSALIQSLSIVKGNVVREVLRDADPTFLLRVGKRDLISQNGWNIFFDKVPLKPYTSYDIVMEKRGVSLARDGARTLVSIEGMQAPGFTGRLEITLYHGSLLMNIAAVMTTQQDSTAILYDAGLMSRYSSWDSVGWVDVGGALHSGVLRKEDTVRSEAVKYRAIAGGSKGRALVVFPAPHQYFYPLDEAFNLRFVWWGGRGIGIRQEPEGDHRFVPWFNAPPGTAQRLNFFCYLGERGFSEAFDAVKAYTRGDKYKPLAGYKTMASHFHNEFITKVVLAQRPVPDEPAFVKYFKEAGINIVHLAEFHGVGHPKGPDERRLKELDALFAQCRRLSDDRFLLLPGEEPNEFFGGHWLAFFPHPVYWVMSHRDGDAFVSDDPRLGKVYHIGNAREMLELLERERGLAWTAHPRTKGSTGYPDTYRQEPFFLSDRWLGAAWKSLPADLSQPRLGKRVLDLMDDMNNWGLDKRVLAEADLFTIDQANEMYGHMNVNYLRFGALPAFDKGWGSVLDSLRRGRFFSTTGEVLIPSFTVEGGKAVFTVEWTFPLQFAELVSGDGDKVYRDRIPLNNTAAFGRQTFRLPLDLSHRRWVRLEVWDVAVNGAFTQTIRLK